MTFGSFVQMIGIRTRRATCNFCTSRHLQLTLMGGTNLYFMCSFLALNRLGHIPIAKNVSTFSRGEDVTDCLGARVTNILKALWAYFNAVSLFPAFRVDPSRLPSQVSDELHVSHRLSVNIPNPYTTEKSPNVIVPIFGLNRSDRRSEEKFQFCPESRKSSPLIFSHPNQWYAY